MKHILLLLTILGLFACNHSKSKLSPELQKVLTHYSQSPSDTLKLRAAQFLIENMEAHYTLNSKGLEAYYTFIDSVFQSPNYFYQLDSIYKNYIRKNSDLNLEVYPDKQFIKADYLIKNIDQAFDDWRKPWAKHLSFEQFCEYILPYRIDDEILEPWRASFKKKYSNCFSTSDFDSLNTLQACIKLNNELKKINIQNHYNPTYIAGMKPSTIIQMKMGNCIDYSNLGVYAMRSMGIPVAIDETADHAWDVVITPTGPMSFSAGDKNPGEHLNDMKSWKHLPKVFRQTFSVNRQSLPFICGKEDVPPIFTDSCRVDVSREYFKVTDMTVNVINKSTSRHQFLYLCQFTSKFLFLDWARIINDKATFKNMGDSVVYFPVYYSPMGIRHAAFPIVVKKKGSLHETLKPDFKNLQSMVLHRKYPIKNSQLSYLKRALGGIFQGANKADFSDGETIYKINSLPETKMNLVKCTGKPYRYVRYLAPDNSYCSMGEIEFYETANAKPLKGKVLGTDGWYYRYSPNCTKDKVFDGDPLTYFDAPNPNGAWVGLDLGTKKCITEIKYITRNDDNGVRKGQLYELQYMGLNGWTSIGMKTALADSVVFHRIPSHAIYLLKNLTRGREERIFTYERGGQVWW